MFWRVLFASIVTLAVPFFFRIFQVGALLAAPILILVDNIFYRKAQTAEERASMPTIANFFANLFSNAAGVVLALLILRHLPFGFYWLIAGLVLIEALLISIVLSDVTPSNPPVPFERTMIFLGSICSIPVFYPLAAVWLN